MNLSSNFKGSITEMECALAFTKLGYFVSFPFGGQARYDFLADINGKIIRIQVKTAKDNENGSFSIECRNSHYLQGHHTHSKYAEDEIDYFATFFNNKCYLFSIKDCGSTKTIRYEKPTTGMRNNINWYEDYELEEVIKTI